MTDIKGIDIKVGDVIEIFNITVFVTEHLERANNPRLHTIKGIHGVLTVEIKFDTESEHTHFKKIM